LNIILIIMWLFMPGPTGRSWCLTLMGRWIRINIASEMWRCLCMQRI